MGVRLLDRLPLELWDQIIDCFDVPAGIWPHPDDYQALSNFSIASSSPEILERCQRLLLSRADIHKPVEAGRLLGIYERHEDLVKHLQTICISPDGPLPEYEDDYDDYSDEEEELDEDGDEGGGVGEGDPDASEGSDTELEDETGRSKWEVEQNPFENDTVLALLAKLSSSGCVKNVVCLGQEGVTEHWPDRWHPEALRTWGAFLSLPSIVYMSLLRLSWPVELFGHSQNLEYLDLRHIATNRTYSWRQNAPGMFPKLQTLDVHQEDMMGVCLTDLVKERYVYEKIQSTTFRTLILHAPRDKYAFDTWAWLEMLDSFSAFGSNTMTTLDIAFPLGVRPDNKFEFNWRKESAKTAASVAQLKALETLRCKFYCDSDMEELKDYERHGANIFEPYLSTLVEGLIQGKAPFKHLQLDITGMAHHFRFSSLPANPEGLRNAKTFLTTLVKAPIWRKLDTWLSQSLPGARLELKVEGNKKRHLPVGFIEAFQNPLLAQLPKLRASNAVEIELVPSRW